MEQRGRVTRGESGHGPRKWFWVASWKRTCVFITLPWPLHHRTSSGIAWHSPEKLLWLWEPLWPPSLGRRIPEKTGASLVLFLTPLNRFCLLWKDLFALLVFPTSTQWQGSPEGRVPLLGDSIRLCTQELVGLSLYFVSVCLCPPCPSAVLSPTHTAPRPLSHPHALFGLFPPASVCARGVSVPVPPGAGRGAGGTRARCGPCSGFSIGSSKAGEAGRGVRPQAPAEKADCDSGRRDAGYSHCKGMDDSSRPSPQRPPQPPQPPPGASPGPPTQRPLSRRAARPLAAGPQTAASGAPRLPGPPRGRAGTRVVRHRPSPEPGAALSPSGALRLCPFWRSCNPFRKGAIHKTRSFPPRNKEASDCSVHLEGEKGFRVHTSVLGFRP